MENFDLALEAGKEELALDRPPCCSKKNCEFLGNDVSESGVSITKKVGECDTSNGLTKKHPFTEDDDTNFDTDEVNYFPENHVSLEELINNDRNHKDDNFQNSCNSQDHSEMFNSICNDINPIENEASATLTSAETVTVKTISSSLNTSLQQFKKITERKSGKHTLVSCLKSKKSHDWESNGDETKKNNLGSKAKKIVFLEGEKLVSEYIEPYDPWLNVRTPSHTEVVSFYRNTCQKLRCKPLDKVLKQIQDIPDLSQRAGTLVLRGSRLDSKSCEALESIFRRVQYENLDIENCSLEEEGASALIEMIEFYRSTCKLNIACNPKIGVRGWQTLCRMLRKTPCLTYLDARRTLLTDVTMACFGRCLKADPYLKVLHLEGVFLSGRPLLILTTAMKYNHILEELYIGDNDLTSSDGPPLGAMLTYNTTLQLLDIRNNQIRDIGLAHVSNGLSDQADQPFGGGLCSLIIWNTGLTHEAMSYLSEGLIKTRSLKALNLGQNRIGDLGMQKLKHGLIKNKSLRKVGLLNTKIGSEGAVALAEVLADSLTLTRIDLRGNELQVAGLMAFSMALKVNQSLIKLDLDKAIKKEPGMESVIQTVLVDIYNYCHRNKQICLPLVVSSSVDLQSSDSNYSLTNILGKDVFHPEELKQPIIPFSPVAKEDIFNEQLNHPLTSSLEIPVSLTQSNSSAIINPVSRAQTNSEPTKPYDQVAKRESRFSVTKILDTLGNHAAGVASKIATNVASIDLQIKRNNSKEQLEIKSTEMHGALDNTQCEDLNETRVSLVKNTSDEGIQLTAEERLSSSCTNGNYSLENGSQLEDDFLYMRSIDHKNVLDKTFSSSLQPEICNFSAEVKNPEDLSSLEENFTLTREGSLENTTINTDLLNQTTDMTCNDFEHKISIMNPVLLKNDSNNLCETRDDDSVSIKCNLEKIASFDDACSVSVLSPSTEISSDTYNLPLEVNPGSSDINNSVKTTFDVEFPLVGFECQPIVPGSLR